MRRYIRQRHPGACFFFTVVTHQRRPFLTHPENMALLRKAMGDVKRRYPFTIDGIVIMPDHIHAIWQLPYGDNDYSSRWAQIKRRFSMSVTAGEKLSRSRMAKRERGIWQRRFWEHAIRSEEDWRLHMDYIHYNPVKHGYVASPEEWPYSSLDNCIQKGWYEKGWGSDICDSVMKLDLE